MASLVYNTFKRQLLDADIDFSADTTQSFKIALLLNTYAPLATHDYYDDVSAFETSGTGYVAGGASLSNFVTSVDGGDNEGVLDADDITWSTSSITARYAVLYRNTGVESTSEVVCCIDFGSDKTSSNGDFTIQWNAEGIINLN